MNIKIPRVTSFWKHRSGKVYEVLAIANLHATDPVKYPVIVVYGDTTTEIWARPLDRWDLIEVENG